MALLNDLSVFVRLINVCSDMQFSVIDDATNHLHLTPDR